MIQILLGVTIGILIGFSPIFVLLYFIGRKEYYKKGMVENEISRTAFWSVMKLTNPNIFKLVLEILSDYAEQYPATTSNLTIEDLQSILKKT